MYTTILIAVIVRGTVCFYIAEESLPKFLGAGNFAKLYKEAFTNDGLPARYTSTDIDAYKKGAYW